MMKHRALGKTDFSVSEIGLGCWQLGDDFGPVDERTADEILATAYEKGISFYDTADVYGGGLSERRIGRWLKTLANPPIVATKVGRNANLYPDKYSKENVKRSLTDSIVRLGIDCIDLAQLHCVPREVLFAGEIFNWMEDLQQEGIIRHFGASVEMLDEALFCCQHPKMASLQILFNLFRQDAIDALFPIAELHNVGIIARLPLASGLLSGKMQKGRTFHVNDHRNYNRDGQAFHVGETFNGIPYEQGIDLVEQLKTELLPGQNLLDVALRWILDQPQVSTIIAGATKVEQVINNAAVSEMDSLSIHQKHMLKDYYTNKVRPSIRGGI